MVEELLERFSAVVSDVCACLMGFKVCLDLFLEGKFNLGLKQLIEHKKYFREKWCCTVNLRITAPENNNSKLAWR